MAGRTITHNISLWKVTVKFQDSSVESFGGSREIVRDWLERRLDLVTSGAVWCREFIAGEFWPASTEVYRCCDLRYIVTRRGNRLHWEDMRTVAGLGLGVVKA